VKTRFLLAAIGVAFACNPDEPELIGRWSNTTKQTLVIESDLSGRLTQEATCAPDLQMAIHRDPWDAYAFFFVDNQAIYFPVEQKALFAPNEYFCASKDSVAMCRFCRLADADHLECEQTEQKITGRGAFVTHDCNWTRVQTSSTTTSSVSCPAQPDAGTGCRATVLVGDGPDAGI
jgi:hypothetical protein